MLRPCLQSVQIVNILDESSCSSVTADPETKVDLPDMKSERRRRARVRRRRLAASIPGRSCDLSAEVSLGRSLAPIAPQALPLLCDGVGLLSSLMGSLRD